MDELRFDRLIFADGWQGPVKTVHPKYISDNRTETLIFTKPHRSSISCLTSDSRDWQNCPGCAASDCSGGEHVISADTDMDKMNRLSWMSIEHSKHPLSHCIETHTCWGVCAQSISHVFPPESSFIRCNSASHCCPLHCQDMPFTLDSFWICGPLIYLIHICVRSMADVFTLTSYAWDIVDNTAKLPSHHAYHLCAKAVFCGFFCKACILERDKIVCYRVLQSLWFEKRCRCTHPLTRRPCKVIEMSNVFSGGVLLGMLWTILPVNHSTKKPLSSS